MENLRLKERFKSYYLETTENDFNTFDWKFRHFRFVNFKNKTYRIKKNISKSEKLLLILREKCPLHAFFTPNTWLKPVYVGKEEKNLDVLLKPMLYFDIDLNILQTQNISAVKKVTEELIEFIDKEYSHAPHLIVYTGYKGFHLYYEDFLDLNFIRLNPSDRLRNFKKVRLSLMKVLEKNEFILDFQVTLDVYRVLRIPNSLNGNTGFRVCVVETLEKFKQRDSWVFSEDFYKTILGKRFDKITEE